MYLLANGNGGIQAVVNAIKNLVEIIIAIWNIIMNIIKSISLAMGYMLQLIPKIYQIITTLPIWIQAFAYITISICIAYFIIGRQAGKSD